MSVNQDQQLAPRYITVPEAARYLSCHPKTVRRMIAAGDLPGYQIGERGLRLDLHEIDDAVARLAIPNARSGK